MTSPFPGMDPFIEHPHTWEDFHHAYLTYVREWLAPQARPRYQVRIEQRVYLRELSAEERLISQSDVHVVMTNRPGSLAGGLAVATAPTMAFPMELPGVLEIKEGYLEIVDRDTRDVITVIELLSPTNKRGAGDADAKSYLKKRERLMRTGVNLVELDLLRGGSRPQPPASPHSDYQMLVARSKLPAVLEVWSLGVRDPLPMLPIPLVAPDADLVLDTRQVLDRTYDIAGYDTEIYDRPLSPPLLPKDAEWAEELLRGAGFRPSAA